MMHSAIVKDGIVVNRIRGSLPGSVECSKEVGIGWLYDGSTFAAPPQPEPTLDEARTAATSRIESGYRQALKSFDHADTTWDASDDSATVLRDLLNRLANGRGLPRGKSAVTLRDATGAAHEMTAEQVIDLGEAGSDHRDECLETRLTLIDQARAADTVEALDAIDWPALD